MTDVDGVPLLRSQQVADAHRHGGGPLGRVAGATVDGQVVIAEGNGRLSEVDPGSVRVVDSDGPPPWPVSGHGPGQTNPTTGFWHRRGHPIMRIGRTWCWADTGEPHPTFGGTEERPCVLCGMMPTSEGHDACLGTVQGAVSACCGHGVAPGHVLLADQEAMTLPCLDGAPEPGWLDPTTISGGTVTNENLIDQVADGIQVLIDENGGPSNLVVPKGYPHLGLAVVDAVWSARANYDRLVVPVLDAYCATVPSLATPGARFGEAATEHTPQALLDHLGDLHGEDLLAFFGGRHNKSPGTKILKAETVRSVAKALLGVEVDSAEQLKQRSGDAKVHQAVLKVPGVGEVTWRYLCNLVQVERVKPDVMIQRWLQRLAVDRALTPAEAGDLVEQATTRLRAKADDEHITFRAVDHLIWRYESGRLAPGAGAPEGSDR